MTTEHNQSEILRGELKSFVVKQGHELLADWDSMPWRERLELMEVLYPLDPSLETYHQRLANEWQATRSQYTEEEEYTYRVNLDTGYALYLIESGQLTRAEPVISDIMEGIAPETNDYITRTYSFKIPGSTENRQEPSMNSESPFDHGSRILHPLRGKFLFAAITSGKLTTEQLESLQKDQWDSTEYAWCMEACLTKHNWQQAKRLHTEAKTKNLTEVVRMEHQAIEELSDEIWQQQLMDQLSEETLPKFITAAEEYSLQDELLKNHPTEPEWDQLQEGRKRLERITAIFTIGVARGLNETALQDTLTAVNRVVTENAIIPWNRLRSYAIMANMLSNQPIVSQDLLRQVLSGAYEVIQEIPKDYSISGFLETFIAAEEMLNEHQFKNIEPPSSEIYLEGVGTYTPFQMNELSGVIDIDVMNLDDYDRDQQRQIIMMYLHTFPTSQNIAKWELLLEALNNIITPTATAEPETEFNWDDLLSEPDENLPEEGAPPERFQNITFSIEFPNDPRETFFLNVFRLAESTTNYPAMLSLGKKVAEYGKNSLIIDYLKRTTTMV